MPGWTQQQIDQAANADWGDFNNLDPELQHLVLQQRSNPADQAARQQGYQDFAGSHFGDRMRDQAGKAPAMIGVNHLAIDAQRQLGAQSYGQQQQAVGMQRAAAMGQGPSVAAQQGQQGQDQALRAALGHRGGPMLPGQGANMYAAGNAGAQARGQEIGQAQGAWGSGASAMRGQSLQGYQQALNANYGAANLNLGQQQQNLDRELQYQKLAQGGYNADAAGRQGIQDIHAGIYADEMARQNAQQAAILQGVGSGTSGALQAYGGSGQKDRGGKSWGDWDPGG